MITPQYVNKEQTPLKYYHFLRIVLILGVIARFVQGAQLFRSGSNAYTLVYAAAGLLLTIVAAVGLNSMKWYGVLALFGTWGLIILDSIVALVIIYTYRLTYPSAATTIGQIIGCGIVAVPSWIYFMKRRLLFSPLPKNAPPGVWALCPRRRGRTSSDCNGSVSPRPQALSSASFSVQSVKKRVS